MHVLLNGYKQTVMPCLGYQVRHPFCDCCSVLQLLGKRGPAGLSKEEDVREGRDSQALLSSELVLAAT